MGWERGISGMETPCAAGWEFAAGAHGTITSPRTHFRGKIGVFEEFL
jgi:hypothetical protein